MKKDLNLFTKEEEKQLKEGIKDTLALGVGTIIAIEGVKLIT